MTSMLNKGRYEKFFAFAQAQVGMETLFELIFKDVEASKKDATTIPVSEDIDRVKVTEEISKRMGNNCQFGSRFSDI